MWNFRNFTIGFFVVLLLFNLIALFFCPCSSTWLQFYCDHRSLFYISLVSFYLILPVILSFVPCSEFHHRPVICRAETTDHVVFLTFDDGPDPILTPKILEILDLYEIPATFFIIGKKIHGNEELLRQIVQKGHSLGNHSFSHARLWDFFSGGRIRNELYLTSMLLSRETGISLQFFRPPYGVINPMVHRGLKKTGLTVVGWNRRSLDTLGNDKSRILKRTTGNLKPGDILLFHDTSRVTAEVLEEVIQKVRSGGFRFAGLEQYLKTKPDA
jgi:peptidoglycan/xylan/chitin deacetylase (PgdA/CDA1 family)